MRAVTHVTTSDRLATRSEVLASRRVLKKLAAEFGLTQARIAADGAVIVHSDESGYRVVMRYAQAASKAVGAWVNVVTDDAPAAQGVDTEPL